MNAPAANQSLAGKTALVFGVASETSIAWAIANELAARGANIILGYQFRYHVRMMQLAPQLPNLVMWERCDVLKPEECTEFFAKLDRKIDIVVHAIAAAPATAFEGALVDTTAEDFTSAMLVSAHSLTQLSHHALPHLRPFSSIITLSYLGAVRVVKNYKLMGVAKAALEAYTRELAFELGPRRIRVNAISAGPIRTLASSGVPQFDLMLELTEKTAPLRQNITQHDVAKAACFLASDDSRMITGQTLYVDSGYSVVGVAYANE